MSNRPTCRLSVAVLARRAAASLLVLAALGCKPRAQEPSAPAEPAASPVPAASPAPETDKFHLGTHQRAVSTKSAEAQTAFDRGLTLAWAFNYDAAEREFRRAAEEDPTLAMAWWGVALVNGPHINNPAMSPKQAMTSWEGMTRARELAAQGASDIEKALIEALAQRYAAEQPEDRRPLDEAYATAMRALRDAYPRDADIATLAAEAFMDLRPWDLWTAELVPKPQPGTDEIIKTLETALNLDPDHPGANHLYIHTMEASSEPGKATAAAERLTTLVPGAGHLVHMPAHIFARTGRWADASASNQAAIEADVAALRGAPPDAGFYNVYRLHSRHFLAFAEMMRGRGASALEAARGMVAGVPADFLKESALVADGYMGIPIEVLMRFGKWQEILAEPEPADSLPLARTKRLFARATALTALNKPVEAEVEAKAFHAAAAALSEEAVMGNNPASEIVAIARLVLAGEMAAARNDFAGAIKSLEEAAQREDALKYDEPPDWIQPVRHTLGAVLLRAGKHKEAEAVYLRDLERWPENGWSLFGLYRALDLQKRSDEASAAKQRFDKAWADADQPIAATCLCQPPV